MARQPPAQAARGHGGGAAAPVQAAGKQQPAAQPAEQAGFSIGIHAHRDAPLPDEAGGGPACGGRSRRIRQRHRPRPAFAHDPAQAHRPAPRQSPRGAGGIRQQQERPAPLLEPLKPRKGLRRGSRRHAGHRAGGVCDQAAASHQARCAQEQQFPPGGDSPGASGRARSAGQSPSPRIAAACAARSSRSLSRRDASCVARICTASSPAFFAALMPTVATGSPGGIITVE